MTDLLNQAADWISRSRFPVVLTGAGISSESGIPTFRGEEGLWKNFRAEDLATPEAFQRSPETVWEWYNWRRKLISEKSPNAGHFALVEIQKKFPSMPIITQNVDGLHTSSGGLNVVEMHGNIFRSRCTGCNTISQENSSESNLPLCDKCQSLLRPDVVWFHESLNHVIMNKIQTYLSRADLMIVVGTSGKVYPAAGFASTIHDDGGKVIEVNVDPVISFALKLCGKSGEILPHLSGLIRQTMT